MKDDVSQSTIYYQIDFSDCSQLSLFGNELNLFSTFFNVGVIIGASESPFISLHYNTKKAEINKITVPLILLATRIRPSILMPACELCWSILVMGIGGAKTAKTVRIPPPPPKSWPFNPEVALLTKYTGIRPSFLHRLLRSHRLPRFCIRPGVMVHPIRTREKDGYV